MRYITVSLVFVLFTACNSVSKYAYQTDEEPGALKFFTKGWIDPYTKKNYYVNKTTQCLNDLKRNIPKKHLRFAIEGLYYNLPPTIVGIAEERWINTADSICNDDNVHAFVLMIRGNILTEKGRYNNAISCLLNSYKINERLNQPFRASDAKRYLARCLFLKGECHTATKTLYEVFNFLKRKSDFFHQVRKFETMMQLSLIQQNCGDPNKSLFWSRQCLHYVQQTGNSPGQIVMVYENIAQAFLGLNKPDSALLILEKSQKLRQEFKITYQQGYKDFLFGETLIRLKRIKESLFRLKLSYYEFKKSNNLQKIAEIKANIGKCMNFLGKTDSSIFYYQQVLGLKVNPFIKEKVYHELASIYAQNGQFKQAFNYNLIGNNILKTLYKQENSLSLAEIESYHKIINSKAYLTSQKKFNILLFAKLFLLILALLLLVFFAVMYLNPLENKYFIPLNKLKLSLQVNSIQNSKLIQEKELEWQKFQSFLENKKEVIPSLELNTPTESENKIELPSRMLTETDWISFRDSFENKFPDYISRLRNEFTSISNAEIRLFLFIKIGLESRYIAEISGISPESVYKNRKRLRARLGLDKTEKLEVFIQNY